MGLINVNCGQDGTLLVGGNPMTVAKLPATTTIGGSSVAALTTITSVSANALTVGRQGTTNPVLNVDASATTVVTGLNIIGAAAASGLAVVVTSSGTDENLTINALGAGTLTLNGTATGKVILGALLNWKTIATPVAATGAGGGVAGAAALGAGNQVYVSSDGATKGVKFTTSAAGDFKIIINTSSTALNLFAASGGTINGGSPDVGCAIPASKGVMAFSSAANTWIVFDLTAHAGAAA